MAKTRRQRDAVVPSLNMEGLKRILAQVDRGNPRAQTDLRVLERTLDRLEEALLVCGTQMDQRRTIRAYTVIIEDRAERLVRKLGLDELERAA